MGFKRGTNYNHRIAHERRQHLIESTPPLTPEERAAVRAERAAECATGQHNIREADPTRVQWIQVAWNGKLAKRRMDNGDRWCEWCRQYFPARPTVSTSR